MLEGWPGLDLADEAALRLADTRVQEFTVPGSVEDGVAFLEGWVEGRDARPMAAVIWEYLSRVKHQYLGDAEGSVEAFERADALGLVDDTAAGSEYWRIGRLLEGLGRPAEAAGYYRRIVLDELRSGRAYHAQLALQRMQEAHPGLGIEVPEAPSFLGNAPPADAGGEASVPATPSLPELPGSARVARLARLARLARVARLARIARPARAGDLAMKDWKRYLNLNLVGVALLVLAFLASLGMVVSRSLEDGRGDGRGGGKRIVQIMHWQLEPGYRDAMQGVIDAYNALPHVREANVEVRQLDVTERVYAQILNVHVVSGTAPDLCEQGMSSMVRGSGVAQHFSSLAEVSGEPNRYNAPERLPAGLDPRLAELLATEPWRDTLIDGMQGGWNPQLQDFYSVPTSFFGSVKIYYNTELFREARQRLREAAAAAPPPDWYAALFLEPGENPDAGSASGGSASGGLASGGGVVTDTPELRSWIAGEGPPDTLGRMLMLCAAVDRIAQDGGRPNLVPIAGNSNTEQFFARIYGVPFTSPYVDDVNIDENTGVTSYETWLSWRAGDWGFDDPRLVAYFDCLRVICEQFPPGFLGLDREQARRRFVNEQAAMIVSGSWDAKSLYDAAEGTPVTAEEPARPGEDLTEVGGVTRRNFRFGVEVMDFPMPGPGERWHRWITHPASDAQANGGAPYMLYKRSPNKKWALDFLQYLTSFTVNRRFNADAGWLPIVVGADPVPRLRPFAPKAEGFAVGDRLDFDGPDSGNLGLRFKGQFKNLLSGDTGYEGFAREVRSAAADPRTGADRLVYDAYQKLQDQTLSLEALIVVEVARDLLPLPEEEDAEGEGAATPEAGADAAAAAARLARNVRNSAFIHNATVPLHDWHRQVPDEPFPSY